MDGDIQDTDPRRIDVVVSPGKSRDPPAAVAFSAQFRLEGMDGRTGFLKHQG